MKKQFSWKVFYLLTILTLSSLSIVSDSITALQLLFQSNKTQSPYLILIRKSITICAQMQQLCWYFFPNFKYKINWFSFIWNRELSKQQSSMTRTNVDDGLLRLKIIKCPMGSAMIITQQETFLHSPVSMIFCIFRGSTFCCLNNFKSIMHNASS